MSDPQEAYDKAHHPTGLHCLDDPCIWHPFEQRLRPQPMHSQPAQDIPPATDSAAT